MTSRVKLTLLYLALAGLAPPINAGNYYVSPASTSANWASAANSATPCNTQTAFDNAQAGDIVFFRGGLYRVPASTSGDWLSGYYAPNNSGTEGNPIVFMAYPGEQPVFDGTSGEYDKDGHGYGNFARIMSNTRYVGSGSKTYHEYITFDGFTFQCDGGLNEGKITLTGGDNGSTRPRVRGLVVQNCSFNGGTSDNAARVQIDGVWTGTGDNHEGIFISQTTGLIIRNCRIYDYASANHNMNTSAIKTYHSDSMFIGNCEVYDSSHGIYSKSNTDGLTVQYCYIHDNNVGFFAGTTGWWNSPDHSKGYFVSENTDNVLLHNVFSNNRRATISGFTQGGGDLHGFSVIHNTILAATGYTASVGLGSGERQSFYNNILHGPKIDNDIGLLKWYCPNNDAQEVAEGKPEHNFGLDACDHNQFGDMSGNFLIRVKKPNESTVSYPTIAAWQSSGVLTTGGNPGEGSLTSNPLFVNASGTMSQLSDYALQAVSPCKGAGRGGVDMGANITLVGPLGLATDTTSPTVPTNLAAASASASAIRLTWTASTDPSTGSEQASGVTGYRIFRDSALAGITISTVYTDTGLTPGTTYSYTVVAFDAAGNVSPASPAVSGIPHDEASITFADWRAASFAGSDLTNDAVSGPLADPDGCGLNNFARYAFALPARGRVANPITVDTATSAGARYLTLTFPRRPVATDLTYTLESSTDLGIWSAVPGRSYTTGAGPITAEDSVAFGTAGVTRRFLRLRVTQP